MKILMFGAGVIGTIYGYVLAQAGNNVTYYVRVGRKKSLESGIPIQLLDGRSKPPRLETLLYRANVIECLSPADNYDLVIVSVRHYQLNTVLPILNDRIGNADVLIFNGNWEGFDNLDKHLPRSRFVLGFPVAGGDYNGQTLDGALLDEIRLGELDGQSTPRLERIKNVFEGAGLKVDIQNNMPQWLWVHFAINSGIIGAAFKAGGAAELLNSIAHLRKGILAGREALAVCAVTLILGRVNAAMLVNEYPPDVRAKFGTMSAETRRQANIASLPLLAALGLVIVLALAGLRAQTGELTLLNTFIVAVTMFQVWNLIDLVLLDWFLLMTLKPRFMVLPGTEGMAGYRDFGFHFRKFLNGVILTFILGGVVTLLAAAMEWFV